MSRPTPTLRIVELDGLEPAEAIQRIRQACDPERAVLVLATSRDPALAASALFAGADDFALLPRDARWLEEIRVAQARRKSRAIAASAPEDHERLVVDVPQGGLAYEEYERRIVAHALARAGGNRSRAARELGISRPRLSRKIARYGLAEPPTGAGGSSEP
jgi:DNA-binding NtrC family response regulator